VVDSGESWQVMNGRGEFGWNKESRRGDVGPGTARQGKAVQASWGGVSWGKSRHGLAWLVGCVLFRSVSARRVWICCGAVGCVWYGCFGLVGLGESPCVEARQAGQVTARHGELWHVLSGRELALRLRQVTARQVKSRRV
jgi:hypothetical protein